MSIQLPDTKDQLVHGTFVEFAYIKRIKDDIEKFDLLDLLDFYTWGNISEKYISYHFAREKFKKLGGLGALVNSGKKIYVMSLDVNLYCILEESMNNHSEVRSKETKEMYTLHPILEPGLHPNAIDAYYSVNDQIKRMINSESFQKE